MNRNVIIIDDDQVFAASVKKALESSGHPTSIHQQVDLDLIRESKPSVIIVAAELSRISGLSLCGRLRKDPELNKTALLLLASRISPETIRKHAEGSDRADLYAYKPLSTHHIVRLVEQLSSSSTSNSAIHRTPTTRRKSSLPPSSRKNSKSNYHWPVEYFNRQLLAFPRLIPVKNNTRRKSSTNQMTEIINRLETYEERERAFEKLIQDMNTHGTELARKIGNISQSLQVQHTLSNVLEESKRSTEQQLYDTEERFRNFHAEVEKVFTERDTEEQELRRQLSSAQQRLSRLEAALKAVQNTDKSGELDADKQTHIIDDLPTFLAENGANEIGTATGVHHGQSNKIKELHKALDETNRELETLKKQSKKEDEQRNNLRRSLQTKEEEYAQIESTQRQKDIEINELRKQLSARDQRLQETELRLEEQQQQMGEWKELLDEHVVQSESEREHLEDQRQNLLSHEKTLQDQLENLKAENSTYKETAQTLRGKVDQLKRRLKTSEDAHDQKVQRLEADLIELQVELESSNDQVAKLEEQLAKRGNTNNHQLESTLQSLATAHNKIKKLDQALRQTATDKEELATLRAEQERSKGTIHALEQSCEQWIHRYHTEQRKVPQLNEQLKILEDEKISLEARIQELERQIEVRERSLSDRRAEAETLKPGRAQHTYSGKLRLQKLLEEAKYQAKPRNHSNTSRANTDIQHVASSDHSEESPLAPEDLPAPSISRATTKAFRDSTRNATFPFNMTVTASHLRSGPRTHDHEKASKRPVTPTSANHLQSLPYAEEDERQVTEVASIGDLED